MKRRTRVVMHSHLRVSFWPHTDSRPMTLTFTLCMEFPGEVLLRI
jgi:hypothetical protein